MQKDSVNIDVMTNNGNRHYKSLQYSYNPLFKFDIDNIRYINDAEHINSRLLNLLKLKVGFFTKEEFKDQYLREVIKVFSLIVKKKGTRQAILDAINLYFRACRYNGDYVVVTNAKKVVVTGNKTTQKMYYRHSGYPGGLKELKLEEVLEKEPARVVREAVKGMLPKNKLAAERLKRLRVFDGEEHTHVAQNPKEIK